MSSFERPVVFEEELAAGGKWSHVLKRHQVLRITALAHGANVSGLFYNADLLGERYNMPDTLKAQYAAFLTKGRVVMSDMGRSLCSIVADTCGWHDTLCGHLDGPRLEAQYGQKRYQEARNDYHRNARDSFLTELAKWGLGKEDLVPNVNFFSKVTADDHGALSFVRGHAERGQYVELRADMNVLVVLASSPHPLDPATSYAPSGARLTVLRASPPAADDPCRLSRPEAARALDNADRFFA